MKFTIITSKQDPAGRNIKAELSKLGIKTFEIEEDIVYPEHIDKKEKLKDADFLIFASWHKSEQYRKTLSVHPVGNWHQADFGGKPETINKSNAFFLKFIFQTLNEIAEKEKTDYEVTMEVTHHGPELSVPCCFIEIGSTEKEWQDKKPVKIIAETIKQATENYDKEKGKLARNWQSCIAIGGKHYAPNFNKIQLNSKYAISHIILEYSLPLTEEMLKTAISKTIPKPRLAILDWKAIGKSQERQEIISLLNKHELGIVRTSQIKKES